MRYDFGQLVDVFLLKPEMSIAETAWGMRELTSTYGHFESANDAGEHRCIDWKRQGVRECGDLGGL